MKVETLVLGRVLKKEDDEIIEFDECYFERGWFKTDSDSGDFTRVGDTLVKLNLFDCSAYDYYLGENAIGSQWLLRVKKNDISKRK